MVDAEFQRNSVSGLAMEWSEAVAVEGRQSPRGRCPGHAKVAVADVNRVARQYLTAEHAITAVLTPQPSGNPVSSSSFGGREALASAATHTVALPAWAAQALGRLSVPESSLRPVVSQLANGLRLIVQPESVSNTVSIWGRLKSNADLETPPAKEGVNNLLDQLFEYGTHTLDRLEFQSALDEIGANESGGVSFPCRCCPRSSTAASSFWPATNLSRPFPSRPLPRCAGGWRRRSRVNSRAPIS